MNWNEALMTIRLDRLVKSPAAATLGRTLLHSLWEGAAIALTLAVVLLVVRSSRVRYAAACMAMIAMLGGLVVTFSRLAPATPVRILLTGSKYAARVPPGAFPLVIAPPNETKPIDDLAWLAPFWLAGVLIFQMRGVTSWMAARRLRRTGVCCAPALWQTRLDRLGERLRVARPVVLLESCLAEVPVVIGYLRPVVLMPVGMLAGLPAGQVEAILLHELAHIRRYDYLVNLLQVFVEGLLFYHPGVWWISGVMRAERENCCDDLVVAATGGVLEYATALTTLERRRVYRGTALAATDGRLVNRVQRLLGRPQQRYVGVMPMLTAAILTVSVVTAMAALQMSPRVSSAQDRSTPEIQQPRIAAKTPVTLLSQAMPIVPSVPGPSVQTLEEKRAAIDGAAVAGLKSDLQYARWLTEDVVYIISDEERNAFKQLTSNPEREHFVEQFWLRRDPTPGTEENEFKEEHYRRIAYVNEHFPDAKGVAGWRTDRGRIYIQYGPPDEIEAHPSGGAYERPPSQGGGTTETFPFEQWRYKYIDGVGKNLVLEFVDATRSGEYRMTVPPAERDALLHFVTAAPAR